MTTVLVTGATGFIGGAALAQGLSGGLADRWLCLVRAPDLGQAEQRLFGNLARFMGAEDARQALADRVTVIPADLAGLASIESAELDDVTHILHLAADTSFRARGNCHLVNVGGTRALASRARRMRKLSRFVYGGTAMICGANPPPLVVESDYPSSSVEHLVSYTSSKVEAERMLRTEFGDLPIVVARPSIVTGHSVLGCRPSGSIFWMFRAGDRLRLVSGDIAGGIDVVPVDWAADMMLGLLFKPMLAYDVYHLSAGVARCTSWNELAGAFQRCDAAGGPRRYTEFKSGDRQLLRTRFERAFGLDTALQTAMMRAMRAYYEFGALGVVFSNDRLVSEGFRLPPSLPSYLDTCLAQPAGLSIIDQFADDVGMFDAAGETLLRVRPAA
ncbi:MAG: SDR family oxidoreductase [Alphaproteobacteria bacterium]|jgi:nucleoside-diphosphate-sugar epimerase|nr:SDR family oxidoreductase [Alphaproteobacteria bacterium]